VRSNKKNIPHFILCAVLILVLSLISCVRRDSDDSLLIAVSIPPQAWFVSQIAGGNADVLILVPPGQNPHNYEPTPRQIQSLSKASAWILSGTEFEISLLPKIKSLFPDLLIIDGTEGVKFRYLSDHEHHDCDDHDHDIPHFSLDTPHSTLLTPHSSLNIDRHTWLGREPAKVMAENITAMFVNIDMENNEYYLDQCANLIDRVDSVFDELGITLAPLKGKSVFVYHPSFGYFLDEFGIIQEAVEMGGKEPTPRQLFVLMEKINLEKPDAIFVQRQFPVNAARTIANSAGAQVTELDPLAQDWLDNIKHMGQVLQNSIK